MKLNFRYGFFIDVIVSIILLLIIFPIKFYVLFLDSSRATYFLVVVSSIFFVNKFQLYSRGDFYVFASFLFLFLYSVFVITINGAVDLTFIRISFEFLLKYFIALFFLAYFLNGWLGYKFDRLVKVLLFAFFIQATFIYLMLIFPSFQSFIFDYIRAGGLGVEIEGAWRLRKVGLTGWAAYDMAVNMVLPLFILPLISIKKRWFFTLYIYFLGAAFISGRTAFLAIPIIYFISVFIYLKYSYTPKSVRNVLLILPFCCFVVFSVVAFLLPVLKVDGLDILIEWILELFVNFIDGDIGTSSTNKLFTMFFVPEVLTFLFGDGYYVTSEGGYYMGTDVGYLRLILFFGVVGVLSFMACFSLFFIRLTKKLKFYACGPGTELYVFSFFIFLLIVNVKGSIFIDAIPSLSALFLIYNFLIVSKGMLDESLTRGR